jgi:hypothetical protein
MIWSFNHSLSESAFTPAPAPPPAPPSPPFPVQLLLLHLAHLVSKRLHRSQVTDQPSLDGRQQRQKTVTFDERWDVLEFDRDEEEEEGPFFSSDKMITVNLNSTTT